MNQAIEQDKKQIIEYLIENIPFEGWTIQLLQNAFIKNKVNPALTHHYFPEGYFDVFKYIIEEIDTLMVKHIDRGKFSQMRTSEKVKYLVKLRITCSKKYKELLKTGISLFITPAKMCQGFSILWHTADKIWQIAGDKSVDYNYYSKRGILTNIYGQTLLYWLEDESENNEMTYQFLDSKIAQTMKITGYKNKIVNFLNENVKISRLPILRYIWARYT